MPIFICPHCNEPIIIEKKDYKCGVFRHGVYKKNNKPINPHASEKTCKKIQDQIIGCGKPFRIIRETESIEICDYI